MYLQVQTWITGVPRLRAQFRGGKITCENCFAAGLSDKRTLVHKLSALVCRAPRNLPQSSFCDSCPVQCLPQEGVPLGTELSSGNLEGLWARGCACKINVTDSDWGWRGDIIPARWPK